MSSLLYISNIKIEQYETLLYKTYGKHLRSNRRFFLIALLEPSNYNIVLSTLPPFSSGTKLMLM